MTFASRMQHKIYWGGLKKPVEWSLKTWLAPWAYIASVIYHDSYWYPTQAKQAVRSCLESDWGRLFQNWDEVQQFATELGYPNVGEHPAVLSHSGWKAFRKSLGILGTCVTQNPEVGKKRRHVGAS